MPGPVLSHRRSAERAHVATLVAFYRGIKTETQRRLDLWKTRTKRPRQVIRTNSVTPRRVRAGEPEPESEKASKLR